MKTTDLKINKIESKDNTYGKYEIFPFDRGFGNTFGTPLRRILLSSIKGISITGIKVKNVDHEFSTKKGVKDDILRIVFNLQNVIFTMHSSEKETVTLKVHGKKTVKASDLKTPGNVKVVNPDAYITEITDEKAELEIELTLESGYGFELADDEVRNTNPGLIPVNKNFSPVDKVNVNITNTRVGQRTDLEKIIIEIWTNGSVSPDDALKQASELFVDELNKLNEIIQDFKEEVIEEKEEEDEEEK